MNKHTQLVNTTKNYYENVSLNKSPHPCINRNTGKPYDWENPEFTPGIHCTSCRFAILPESKFSDFPYTCANCIEKVRAWKIRSDIAKRAALKR